MNNKNMRRVFIIRKDLNLPSGKLSAMIGHCCEAYWTNLLKTSWKQAQNDRLSEYFDECIRMPIEVDKDIWNNYVNGIFTKTVCEAKNLNQLRKVDQYINEINLTLDDKHKLIQKVDYGWIRDCCKTVLVPENEDGTTTVGIWFRPLPDDIAHKISMKYKLYRD